MGDLRERVPAHSLIEELLRQWDNGTIRVENDQVIIDEEAISWYDGVKGERIVAERLSRLGEGWTVLHSVPIGAGSSDVDHIVIGPAGVFTINTKNSSGRAVWVAGYGMYVGGFPQPGYVRNAITEWHRVESILSRAAGFAVPVSALIVFVDPLGITEKDAPGDGIADIQVLPDDELEGLGNLRRVMSDEQVARIATAAIRPEIWHRNPKPWPSGDHIAREFDALDEAVGWRIARLGQAPVRVDSALAATTAHTAPSRTASSRQASGRSQRPSQRSSSGSRSRSRRSRATPLEKFVSSVVWPVGMLVAVWIFAHNLSQR